MIRWRLCCRDIGCCYSGRRRLKHGHVYRVKQNKISQHENCYISETPEYFCTKFRSFVCHNIVHWCIALCCIYLTYVKLTEMQTSRTKFTTEQKVHFIIKVIEQQVPPLLWRHYFYVYVQHSIVTNSLIFQVIIAVRPITLVVGKMSYEDKARIKTLWKLGLDTEQLLQNFRKKVGRFAQWKQSVNGLMSMGQQRNESHVAIGLK